MLIVHFLKGNITKEHFDKRFEKYIYLANKAERIRQINSNKKKINSKL